jgi:pyruvate/2-oxoglutarate dehydrogenase complex dihydrolipoamide dehydrogenase (E3) component
MEKPDAVIIATGSKPTIPHIPGIDRQNVVTAHDVLNGKVDTGHNVIIVGGGLIGSETADHLANHGKKVTIVEMLPEIAKDEEANVRYFLLKDLKEKDVAIYTNAVVKEIVDDGVIAELAGKVEKIGPADTIVIAVGVKPVNDLAIKLEGRVERVITVGDALEARKALEAIEEGYSAGLEI